MSNQNEGSLRILKHGEVTLAKRVFGDTIEYHKVWIHHGSFFPFELQDDETAMSPNGELYFRYWYRDDFSCEGLSLQNLFIHEMSHVWQRNRGMNILLRGLASRFVSYCYRLDGRLLRCYPMEQQAQIIADYFILKTYGYRAWIALLARGDVKMDGDIAEAVIGTKYKQTMRGFPWS